MLDVIAAFRELDSHPETIFTVLTGEGRFFSAGADVKAVSSQETPAFANDADKKIFYLAKFASGTLCPVPSQWSHGFISTSKFIDIDLDLKSAV